MLEGERLAVLERRGHPLRRELAIVRVDQLHVRLERERLGSALQAEDPVELVRPRDGVVADVPFPAADVGEPGLRLGEASCRRLSLGERGAHDEQADGNDRERGLGELHPLGHGLPAEGMEPSTAPHVPIAPTRNAEAAAPTCLKRSAAQRRKGKIRYG